MYSTNLKKEESVLPLPSGTREYLKEASVQLCLEDREVVAVFSYVRCGLVGIKAELE